MKNLILLFAIIFSLASCTADDASAPTSETPTGLTGPQFDVVISNFAFDYAKLIVVNEVPTHNTGHWYHFNSALVDENTVVGLRVETNEQTDNKFEVTVFQHQEYNTIDQPNVTYTLTIPWDIKLKFDDLIVFKVGKYGVIPTFEVYRNFTGQAHYTKSELLYQGVPTLN